MELSGCRRDQEYLEMNKVSTMEVVRRLILSSMPGKERDGNVTDQFVQA